MALDVFLRVDGQWTSVRNRIRYESGVEIERGRDAEAGLAPSSLTFVADNRDLWWSTDVPGTTNYGLFGRGTPIRAEESQIVDTFTRTESDGWGTCEEPEVAWEIGSGSASDYSVTSGVGRHTLTTTGTVRQSRIELTLRASMVLCSVTIGATAATAAARAAVVLRKTPDGSAHYRAELEFGTSGAVTANLVRLGGPGTSTLDTAAAGTYAGGDKWWIRFLAVGSQLYMSAWADTDDEPADWLCEAEDVHFRRGQLALRSVRDSGNTNSNLTMDFDDLVLSEPRFFGEIWSMRPMSDRSGRDLTMTIEASGLFRRLSNTDKPVRSSLYGTLSTGSYVGSAPVAYWPLEDGAQATQLEQVFPGAGPGQIAGPVDMGADSSLPGSAALPSVDVGGVLSGSIPTFDGFDPTSDFWTISWLMKIDGPPEEDTILARVSTVGDVAGYEIVIESGGLLLFRGPKLFQLLIADAYVFVEFDPYDTEHEDDPTKPSLWGQWVTFTMYNDPTTDTIGLTWAHALSDSSSYTLTYSDASYVWHQPSGVWTLYGPASYGHFAAFDTVAILPSYVTSGFAGEKARERVSRLCELSGVPVQTLGTGAEPMGPQTVDTLIAGLEECQSTDLGIAREARHVLGVEFNSHEHRYNQAPAATITAGNVREGLDPVRDDQNLATSVTATRPAGTAQMFTVADDDVFHLTPADTSGNGVEGVGLVEASISPNVATDRRASSQASWHAHLRATKDLRLEDLTLRMTAPAFRADPQLAFDVAGLVEGDVLRITDTPAWMHPGGLDMQVQGIREYTQTRRLNDTSVTTVRDLTINLTPARPWEVWTVDTAGSTIVVARDDDDTSLTVDTSRGPAWQTSPDPPFAIQAMTGGEAMLVTGCTTATPTHIATGAASYADNSSVVPALPAGITPDVGQLLLILACTRGTAADPVLPAGWTQVAAQGDGELRVFGRYYVSGDTAPTITITGGAAGTTVGAQMAAFSGLSMNPDLNNLVSASANGVAGQQNSSAQNIAYPAITPRRTSTAVFILAKKDDDWTGVATPAGMTEVGDSSSTTGSDMGMAWYFDVDAGNVLTLSAGTLTVTGGASAASTAASLALRPLQTLTVERSLNGVVGSLAAGEQLHVYRHGVVPL